MPAEGTLEFLDTFFERTIAAWTDRERRGLQSLRRFCEWPRVNLQNMQRFKLLCVVAYALSDQEQVKHDIINCSQPQEQTKTRTRPCVAMRHPVSYTIVLKLRAAVAVLPYDAALHGTSVC